MTDSQEPRRLRLSSNLILSGTFAMTLQLQQNHDAASGRVLFSLLSHDKSFTLPLSCLSRCSSACGGKLSGTAAAFQISTPQLKLLLLQLQHLFILIDTSICLLQIRFSSSLSNACFQPSVFALPFAGKSLALMAFLIDF